MAKPTPQTARPPAPAQAAPAPTSQPAPAAPTPSTPEAPVAVAQPAVVPPSAQTAPVAQPVAQAAPVDEFAALAAQTASAAVVPPGSNTDNLAPIDPTSVNYNDVEDQANFVTLDDGSHVEFEIVKAIEEVGKKNADPSKAPSPNRLVLTCKVLYPFKRVDGEHVRDGVFMTSVSFIALALPIFKSLWVACDALDENGNLRQDLLASDTSPKPNKWKWLEGEIVAGKIKNQTQDKKVKNKETGVESIEKRTYSGIAWNFSSPYACPEMQPPADEQQPAQESDDLAPPTFGN